MVTIQMVLRSPSMCIPVEFSSFQFLQGKDGVGVPAGGKSGQVLKKNSDKDFDTEWEDDVAGQCGTKVTIEGEEVAVFPADVYVRQMLSTIVDGAPEVLDTFAEIAKALGNDPNLATTIFTELSKKLDKSTQARCVYANDANGNPTMHTVECDGISGGTIPLRRSGGRIATGTATDGIDAVPLAQLNEILDARLGSLDAALDEIIASQEAIIAAQNALIGGVS